MLAVLTWWFLIQIFGLAALPLTFRLFRRLPDRGYGVSKALGLLLTSYLFWLLGVLGFLRNDSGSIMFSLITVAAAALLLYHSRTPNPTPLRFGDHSPQFPIPPFGAKPLAPHARAGEKGTSIPLSAWLRANWKIVLITELVFAATFFGWSLYRAYVPRIMTSGGEKFMELAFLNSFERAETLPPHDPWLSGFAISYYYFGYLMMSVLIRLSGVTSAVGFNIGGALLFALTATGAFSLVYNLVANGQMSIPLCYAPEGGTGEWANRQIRPAVAVALLGMVFVVLLSNFEGPLEVAHWKGIGSEGMWEWLDIADLDQPPPTHEGEQSPTRLVRPLTGPGWGWWWRASRVVFDYNLPDWPNRYNKGIDPPPQRRENIDEFPFFSFLHGDMHPHLLSLPFIMLALTASLALFRVGGGETSKLGTMVPEAKRSGIGKWELVLFALIFGALGFLNTWDLPIQLAIAVGAYSLGRLSHQSANSTLLRFGDYFPQFTNLRPILTLALTLTIGGLLLYAPFYVGLQSQAGGPLVHVHSSTRLAQFGVMFGPLLLILVSFLAWGVWRVRSSQPTRALRTGLWTSGVLLLLALGVLLMTALAIQLSPRVRELVAPGVIDEPPVSMALRYLAMRLGTPWVTLLLAGMIGAAVALLRSQRFSHIAQFSLLLIIAGAVMTLTPEYVYLKDVFGVRLNTIFKFYFQAWVLWAVAAAGAVYAMLVAEDGLESTGRWLFGGGLALVVGLGLVYPLAAIPDRVKEFPEAPTLDGTIYFATEQPADYAAIQWLNTHVEGTPVILETPGGAYQYEGRVSAQTGLPTLLGWAGHENQWRGNTVEQDKRRPVIEELCKSSDTQRTLTLLDEYDITYVYVGPLERKKCPANALKKFDRLMDIVYDHDGVTIYRIK